MLRAARGSVFDLLLLQSMLNLSGIAFAPISWQFSQ
jgi:hypothetical protein